MATKITMNKVLNKTEGANKINGSELVNIPRFIATINTIRLSTSTDNIEVLIVNGASNLFFFRYM